jgi:hypothetical protein
VVEHLPGTCEALSSNSNPTKKKRGGSVWPFTQSSCGSQVAKYREVGVDLGPGGAAGSSCQVHCVGFLLHAAECIPRWQFRGWRWVGWDKLALVTRPALKTKQRQLSVLGSVLCVHCARLFVCVALGFELRA